MSRDVLSIRPDAPVLDALRMMQASDVRHLPVVNNDRLVGILSDRDLRNFEISNWSEDVSSDIVRKHLNAPVSTYMTQHVVTVTPETPVDDAVHALLEYKLTALPVLEAGTSTPVGMLSTIDVLLWAKKSGKLAP